MPPCAEGAEEYIKQAVAGRKLSGDGPFGVRCARFLEQRFGAGHALLTTSGSHALDMAARLCGLEAGDEVIMPSFTFSSTANAFAGLGARIVFIDIRPDTMNMDEALIEAAITPRTKAIAPVHYAGVATEMDAVLDIARRHNLIVVEDAAQGMMSCYKGRALGTLGDFGCYSFHETKNYSMGEGGALLLRDASRAAEAEIIWEKGTDRSRFMRGEVDKYTWRGWGSSYLPSELCSAYLWAQLERAEAINEKRLALWGLYREMLEPLARRGAAELPVVPPHCTHNAHMFYLKLKDEAERGALAARLREAGILAVSHYVPLHSAPAGLRFGRFFGQDAYTTRESLRLLRLPLYCDLSMDDAALVAETVLGFFA